MTDRVPVHDLDAERILLATIAADPGCIPEVADIVRPEHCYRPEHQEILAACYALDESGAYVEPAAVIGWLADSGRIGKAGGIEFVGSLLDRTATTQSPDQHARRIVRLAAVRQVGLACNRIHHESYGSAMSDVESWLAEVPETVREAAIVGLSGSKETLRGVRDVASALLGRLTEDTRPDGSEERVGTGIESLDEQIGKLARGAVHIVAARPGVGKTALAHQMVMRAARRGVNCVYFSLEMRAEDLLSRSVAQIASVNHKLLELRKVDDRHRSWSDVARAIDEVSKLPIVYDDAAVQTIASIRGSMHRSAKRLGGPIGLAVVDYVQLIKTSMRRGASRAELVGENAHALLAMAKEFDVALIEVSQLSRPMKGQKPKAPQLEDLRESGDLEQDARVVITIFRPDDERAGTAELHVQKCRQGGCVGMVPTIWCGPTMSFSDMPNWRDQMQPEPDEDGFDNRLEEQYP